MKGRARMLRRRATDAERSLWRYLRHRRLNGYKFRRQHRIGPYIVDFVCMERAVVIELDGGQHMGSVEYDEQRTRFLEVSGYRVLRFWNNQVLLETDAVLERILAVLEERR